MKQELNKNYGLMGEKNIVCVQSSPKLVDFAEESLVKKKNFIHIYGMSMPHKRFCPV